MAREWYTSRSGRTHCHTLPSTSLSSSLLMESSEHCGTYTVSHPGTSRAPPPMSPRPSRASMSKTRASRILRCENLSHLTPQVPFLKCQSGSEASAVSKATSGPPGPVPGKQLIFLSLQSRKPLHIKRNVLQMGALCRGAP